MTENTIQKAVVYCRVSSAAQTKRGDGLGSQDTRCREYARMKGYEVVARFDDDLTGKVVQRPSMKAMLSFIRKHRTDNCAEQFFALAVNWNRLLSNSNKMLIVHGRKYFGWRCPAPTREKC